MRLRIEEHDGKKRIWIDGEERHDVRSCTVFFDAGSVTTATMDFYVSGLDCVVSRHA